MVSLYVKSHCAKMVKICVFVLFMSCFHARSMCSDADQKRLLMTDPTYIEQQLNHLQSEIQELRVNDNLQKSTIDDLKTNVNLQKSTIDNLQNNILAIQDAGKGTHFVRWGRMDCPGNFSVVYSGYSGGSYYSHSGAASEYVCLPPDPTWGPHKDSSPYFADHMAFMYGSEYEDPNMFEQNILVDAPCVVCQSPSHSMTLMIPGRTQCYSGWTEAYRGDLASGNYDNSAASQYVCMDQHPQALAGGGNENNDGKLFYAVFAKCGSLKCPPYEDNKHLSCVVCVK